MADMEQVPEYKVQLRTSCRLVDGQPKFGTCWELSRFKGRQEGKWTDFEILFASPEVFEDQEDAKRDAVQKLEPLICCADSPLRIAFRTAIDWIVDENVGRGFCTFLMVELRPFQRRFLKESTRLGIDTAALSIPRGNGKSWLAGQYTAHPL